MASSTTRKDAFCAFKLDFEVMTKDLHRISKSATKKAEKAGGDERERLLIKVRAVDRLADQTTKLAAVFRFGSAR